MTGKSPIADTTLREVTQVRQISGEHRRRWFSSSGMDLVAWYDGDDLLVAFQLCYDKHHRERALIWKAGEQGLTHMAVDDGEQWPLNYKSTPVLLPDGAWQPASVIAQFRCAAGELPAALAAAVEGVLRAHA